MAPKRSKLDQSPKVTLEQFFKPSLVKAKSTPKVKSQSTPKQHPHKQDSVIPLDADIIVIEDSDEEAGQTPSSSKPAKRRKVSCEPSTSSAIEQKSFGKPFLLLTSNSHSNSKESARNSEPNCSSTSAALSFGRPVLLLNTASSSSWSCNMPKVEISETDDISWEMGDDEMITEDEQTNRDIGEVSYVRSEQDSDDIEIIEEGCSVCGSLPPIHHANCTLQDVDVKLEAKTAPPTAKTNSNLFSVLMSSHKENEAWKEASSAESKSFRPTKNTGRRKAPFYKVLQGMPIAVDAFKYGAIPGVTAYFLTHAHSDHYTNLSSSWKNGPIYCSEGTANLIKHMLKVDPKWVHPLPIDTPCTIPNTSGVQVTLIEANHCPGSSLFFFEGNQTVNAGDSTFNSSHVGTSKTFRYLHCGDFRASPQHVLHPAVKGKMIDHVYLDTTYLDPKYTFPPQPLVIHACAELARRISKGESTQVAADTPKLSSWLAPTTSLGKGKQKAEEHILFVVGTYSIGKERIVKAIAQALQTKVYCDARKSAILRCQADAELDALLTSNPLQAQVHLVPLGVVSSDKLKPYVERYKGHFTRAVAFRPTGWTYTQPSGTDLSPSIETIIARAQKNGFVYSDLRPNRQSTTALQMYPVPYSEHSSFFELTCFSMSFDWGRMIATVNVGSEASRGKMAKWVQKWEAERKKNSPTSVVPYRKVDYW